MQVLVFLVEMLMVAGAAAVTIASLRENGARIVEALAGEQARPTTMPAPRRIIRVQRSAQMTLIPLRAAA